MKTKANKNPLIKASGIKKSPNVKSINDIQKGGDKGKTLTLTKIAEPIPLNELSKQQKIVTIHTLNKDLNITAHEIAKIMEISESSAYRYLREYEIPASDDWQAFKKLVKEMFQAKAMNLEAKAYRTLEEKMPDAKFYDIVGLVKILNDAKREDAKLNVNVEKANLTFEIKRG